MTAKKACFVYIVECLDGSYYTGITDDIGRRLKEHASGDGALYVRMFGLRGLVFLEECENRGSARRREIQIKRMERRQKDLLVEDYRNKVTSSTG